MVTCKATNVKQVLITQGGSTYRAVVAYDGDSVYVYDMFGNNLSVNYDPALVVYDTSRPCDALLVTNEEDWRYLFE